LVNFRTLDLNLLRVFDMVMAEGSLTRAAAALAMTQPAVSHALKRLHATVGETLFVRSAFGMKPTARAEALWPDVRAALGALQQALAPADFDPQRDPAVFRIATTDATAAAIAPAFVTMIESERALTHARMVPLTTRDPRSLLLQGDIDLAIGQFPSALSAILAEGRQGQLRHQRLHETRYVCAMRLGHPLAGQPLTLDAYCAAHHLLVSISGRGQGLVDEALAVLGKSRRIVLTVNQYYTAGLVVRATDLVTVLPASFVAATGVAAELVTRELPFEMARVAVDMVWAARRDREPSHRWLRALVQRAAAEG
jgi:DNA-binding transcriptional LysR family regulator